MKLGNSIILGVIVIITLVIIVGVNFVFNMYGLNNKEVQWEHQVSSSHLVMENSMVDLGEVSPGNKYHLKYNFKNKGRGDLVIENIVSTCGCTIAKLSKERYISKEKGCLDVDFQPPYNNGPGEKKLTILSNDPDHKNTELSIKFNVVIPIEVEPAKLDLFNLQKGFPLPQITLNSKDNKEFTITSISSTNDDIEVSFDSQYNGVCHILRAEVNESQIGKELNGSIVFYLKDAGLKEVYLPYTTKPAYDASPKQVLISNPKSDQLAYKDVVIKSNYNNIIEYVDISSLKNNFIAKCIKKDNTKLTIRVEPCLEKATSRFFDDVITVSLVDEKKIEIKCLCWMEN